MDKEKLVLIFLRLSIASVFIYAAAAATLHPENWIGYLPEFLRTLIPAQFLLTSFSLYQLLVSIWILSGLKTRYAAAIAALTLLGIIGANITQADILFRDFAIFFAAIALAIADNPQKNKEKENKKTKKR